jgi:hypothetical protein
MNPHPRARLTGAIYLAYFLTAIPAQFLATHAFPTWGLVFNVLSFALYIAVSILFYFLFKPAGRSLSLTAAICSLAGSFVGLFNLFHHMPQINPLWFFGPYCLLIGILILRSTFLPWPLGVLMALAGIGWLGFLYPPIAHQVGFPIEALGILAEAALMLWLLIAGVNLSRWKKQSRLTPNPL